MRLPIVLVLLAVSFCSGCSELLTGDSDTGRKNWAVVVGVADYQESSYDLQWADEDALDLYDALRHSKYWDADKITLLTNSSATKDGIRSAIAALSKRISADDYFVFYFSGHGSIGPDQPPLDEGDGLDEYLAPYDAMPNSTAHDLSDDELEVLLSALPTNNILVILDTGFSGGTTRGNGSGKEKAFVRTNVGAHRSTEGMTNDLSRPGYLLLTAAQAGQPALESNQLRNGVFTYYFVEGLQGSANPGKKNVSAQQAFEYAAPRANAFAAGQMPQLVDNRGKSFRVSTY